MEAEKDITKHASLFDLEIASSVSLLSFQTIWNAESKDCKKLLDYQMFQADIK